MFHDKSSHSVGPPVAKSGPSVGPPVDKYGSSVGLLVTKSGPSVGPPVAKSGSSVVLLVTKSGSSVGMPVTISGPSVGTPVTISGPKIPVPTQSEFWMLDLGLFVRDKLILQSTEWLNDGIINAAQLLLKRQVCSEIKGWQSPQLSKRVSLFRAIPENTPFIQIWLITLIG